MDELLDMSQKAWRLKKEIRDMCQEIFDLVNNHLLPAAHSNFEKA